MDRAALLKKGLGLAFSFFLLLAAEREGSARLLQIIHTNDLHSHLEHAEDHAVGGYAAVKGMIKQLQAEGAEKGLESLTVDAGDFTEGSQFFLSNHGEDVWRTMEAMGYEAVAMGNHDWLLGPEALDKLLGKINPSFPIVAANFGISSNYKNIRQHVKPYFQLKKAGLRIGILGVTTDEFVFSWRNKGAGIGKPNWAAIKYIPELRKNNDIVIALTHIGVKRDVELVQKTKGIDLVIGGHSHTLLTTPVFVKDKRNQEVPIVQAGEHGEHVGELIVDIEPNQPVRVVSYRVIPVFRAGPQDEDVKEKVEQARENLNNEYGKEWLEEVIGYSEVPMTGPAAGPTIWSSFVIDSMREAAKADLALDVREFYGQNQLPGPINREQLFEFYPRVFDFNKDPYAKTFGWTVWTSKVRGLWLKTALNVAIKYNLKFNASGVTYDLYHKKGGKLAFKNLRVNGKKVKWHKNYTMAYPEGIGRGITEIAVILKMIFKNSKNTKIPIWFAIEDKLRKVGTVKPPPTALLN